MSGVLLARLAGRQDRDLERYATANESLVRLQVRQQIVGRVFFAVVSTFFGITPVLVYVIAALQIHGGNGPTAGTLIAVTTQQTRLFMPIGQLLQTTIQISGSLALFTRVFDYLDLTADIVQRSDALTLPSEQVHGQVALRDVWFSYESEPDAGTERPRRWALRELDLTVEPGQLAAIVGASTAGKTTISYLVPRLYDTDRGAVELDGHDLRDLSLTTLAGAIGMVTQETYLFHATVRDNLAYARPDATQDEVVTAAKAAQIHTRILELENGYDTMVGERGYRLSGGEKQRIAIARVLLKDPRVLLLDEATSALDTVSERLVQQALELVMQGRTTIAIAHRLSTIQATDSSSSWTRGRWRSGAPTPNCWPAVASTRLCSPSSTTTALSRRSAATACVWPTDARCPPRPAHPTRSPRDQQLAPRRHNSTLRFRGALLTTCQTSAVSRKAVAPPRPPVSHTVEY